MSYLAAGSLLLLPGAWIAFGVRGSALSPSMRVAVAATLSPFLAGLQFLALRVAGVGVEAAVWLVVLVNLPALILLVRSFRADRTAVNRTAVVTGGILFLLVVGCAAIPLLDVAYRRFSWHGLIHTDVIYAFANGAILPEDPELAAVALAYPWLGHAYWTVLARVADLSPTVIYLATNLVLLAATGAAVYAAARMLGARVPIALGATVLAALGPNLPGLIGWSLMPPNASGAWWAVLGDLRYTPFLLKYSQFEVMTFSIALFAVLVALAIACVMRRRRADALLASIVTLALGAIYPILFPVAFALLAALLTAPYVRHGPPRLEWKRLGGPLVVLAVVAVATVLFLKLYTLGQTGQAASPSSVRAAGKKTVSMTLTFAPVLWLGWRGWLQADARVREAFLVLLTGVATGIALHIGLRLGAGLNEYKFVFGAGLCAVGPVAVGIQSLIGRRRRADYLLPAVGVAGLAAVMLAFSTFRIPRTATTPLTVDEGAFWLRLKDAPARVWTDAVRSRSDPATILVVREPAFHAAAFTARSLIVSWEGERAHFGHNMFSRFNLVDLRGYSPELYDERVRLLERVYAPETSGPDGLLRELLSLGRPLAIVFHAGEESGFRDWLDRQGIGERWAGEPEGATVYYISSGETDA
jgi:hypothetical protein